MENKFKQFINDNKGFVVFYLIWFFLHLIFISIGGGCSNDFWPFEDSDICEYNFIEFVFYIVAPLLIWAIWKLIGKDIKKAIDDNN